MSVQEQFDKDKLAVLEKIVTAQKYAPPDEPILRVDADSSVAIGPTLRATYGIMRQLEQEAVLRIIDWRYEQKTFFPNLSAPPHPSRNSGHYLVIVDQKELERKYIECEKVVYGADHVKQVGRLLYVSESDIHFHGKPLKFSDPASDYVVAAKEVIKRWPEGHPLIPYDQLVSVLTGTGRIKFSSEKRTRDKIRKLLVHQGIIVKARDEKGAEVSIRTPNGEAVFSVVPARGICFKNPEI